MIRNWRAGIEAFIGISWYLAIVVVLPTLALCVMGFIWLLENGHLLRAVIIWFGVAAIGYAIFYGRKFIQRKRHKQEPSSELHDDDLPDRLEQRAGWSAADVIVWEDCCQQIDASLEEGLPWPELQPRGLALIAHVASSYHKAQDEATFRFTLPEGLLILEETSRRYREMIDRQLPYADRLTVATLMSVYRRQEQIKTSINWLNWGRRALRLGNPVGAVFGELRDRVTDRVFDHVGSTIQDSLKRLLLQELSQVCIDLYSGKLSVHEAMLANYRSDAAAEDDDRAPVAKEPIRTVVFGQVSAGKSSLVNALVSELEAAVDILPTTTDLIAYPLVSPSGAVLNLIDTPGVRALEANDELVALALDADVIVWVARATQPARSALSALIAEVHKAFADDVSRRPPPELLVVSHIDELASDDASGVLQGIRDQLGLAVDSPAVVAGLNQTKGLQGIESIVQQFEALEGEAVQAQLNRRRIELSRKPSGWQKRLTQAKGFAKGLARLSRKGRKEGQDGPDGN